MATENPLGFSVAFPFSSSEVGWALTVKACSQLPCYCPGTISEWMPHITPLSRPFTSALVCLVQRYEEKLELANFVATFFATVYRFFIEKMRRAGIPVNVDWLEGERVLAQENGRVKANAENVQQEDIYSPAFKEWFGDWELAAKKFEIHHISHHDFEGSGKDAISKARDWATKNIIRVYSNQETAGKGKVYISERAITKYLSGKAIQQSDNLGIHLAALKELPSLIKKSIDVETHPDYNKIGDKHSPEYGVNKDVLIHRLYGAGEMDGSIYRVKITLKEYLTQDLPNKPYTYEISRIELIQEQETKRKELDVAPMTGFENSNANQIGGFDNINSILGAKLQIIIEIRKFECDKMQLHLILTVQLHLTSSSMSTVAIASYLGGAIAFLPPKNRKCVKSRDIYNFSFFPRKRLLPSQKLNATATACRSNVILVSHNSTLGVVINNAHVAGAPAPDSQEVLSKLIPAPEERWLDEKYLQKWQRQ